MRNQSAIDPPVRLFGMSNLANLQRFIDAQDPVYQDVIEELAAGRKTSHWMWFVFPQLDGLGRSEMAKHYAIASSVEALAYWQHPVLGERFKQCIELVMAVKGKTAFQIFGTPDDLKFCSSLTLFAAVLPDVPLFKMALEKYFKGQGDPRTVELLRRP